MADRFELVALALPPGCAPESLPAGIGQFVAACWPGMSRAQLLDRARRVALRASLRVMKQAGSGNAEGVRQYALVLEASDGWAELVAHVRRVVRRRGARRAKVSLPPPRDVRQGGLF
ncbi:hypothetical protein [Paraburkholderia tropica]|uniref:hypothetical protein n=1 Tax=Paraburkholderia tropica TaxID=92647 RepID=UPI002AB2BF74|nr:hypothetical protein [Paraburkholderia tropica]